MILLPFRLGFTPSPLSPFFTQRSARKHRHRPPSSHEEEQAAHDAKKPKKSTRRSRSGSHGTEKEPLRSHTHRASSRDASSVTVGENGTAPPRRSSSSPKSPKEVRKERSKSSERDRSKLGNSQGIRRQPEPAVENADKESEIRFSTDFLAYKNQLSSEESSHLNSSELAVLRKLMHPTPTTSPLAFRSLTGGDAFPSPRRYFARCQSR